MTQNQKPKTKKQTKTRVYTIVTSSTLLLTLLVPPGEASDADLEATPGAPALRATSKLHTGHTCEYAHAEACEYIGACTTTHVHTKLGHQYLFMHVPCTYEHNLTYT